MTDLSAEQQPLTIQERRRSNLVGIAAPVLALLSLVVAVVTSNFDAKLKHIGLTLMMVCLGAYVFHLRGLPAAERPPVKLTPTVLVLIGGVCAGSIICGLGMAGPLGLAMQYVPTILACLIGGWLYTPAGKAKRAEIAKRS